MSRAMMEDMMPVSINARVQAARFGEIISLSQEFHPYGKPYARPTR
jgi:hypothetical protein